ncbi:hypothetical protein LSB85_003673 [Salmonella enterica]|nr:hypothetical protein [Salmonella enterica]
MEKHNQVLEARRKLLDLPYNDAPLDSSVIERRLQAVATYYAGQDKEMLGCYLSALGFARNTLIAARAVLESEGKKRYESFLKSARSDLSSKFSELDPRRHEALQALLDVPFRKSSAKDLYELKLALRDATEAIISYRHSFGGNRFRECAETAACDVGCEALSPELASLVIAEVTDLVACAVTSGVYAYNDTGLTCAEFIHLDDDDDDDDSSDCGYSPEMYDPVYGIAEQCLWYDLNDTLDDFILSLAGGLLYAQCPSMRPSLKSN